MARVEEISRGYGASQSVFREHLANSRACNILIEQHNHLRPLDRRGEGTVVGMIGDKQ